MPQQHFWKLLSGSVGNSLAVWNSAWLGRYTQLSSDAAHSNIEFLYWHFSLHSAPSNLFAGQNHYLHQATSTLFSEHWNMFLFPLGTTKLRFYPFTLWVGKGPRIGGPSRLGPQSLIRILEIAWFGLCHIVSMYKTDIYCVSHICRAWRYPVK